MYSVVGPAHARVQAHLRQAGPGSAAAPTSPLGCCLAAARRPPRSVAAAAAAAAWVAQPCPQTRRTLRPCLRCRWLSLHVAPISKRAGLVGPHCCAAPLWGRLRRRLWLCCRLRVTAAPGGRPPPGRRAAWLRAPPAGCRTGCTPSEPGPPSRSPGKGNVKGLGYTFNPKPPNRRYAFCARTTLSLTCHRRRGGPRLGAKPRLKP